MRCGAVRRGGYGQRRGQSPFGRAVRAAGGSVRSPRVQGQGLRPFSSEHVPESKYSTRTVTPSCRNVPPNGVLPEFRGSQFDLICANLPDFIIRKFVAVELTYDAWRVAFIPDARLVYDETCY